MNLQVQEPAPKDRPLANDSAATTQADGGSLPNLPAYVVLLITRYGTPRRRVYLDLGAARTAVARAHTKGKPAELVLCKLEPVAPDLDGGELS